MRATYFDVDTFSVNEGQFPNIHMSSWHGKVFVYVAFRALGRPWRFYRHFRWTRRRARLVTWCSRKAERLYLVGMRRYGWPEMMDSPPGWERIE